MGSARETLQRLYDALGRCDGSTMAGCYTTDGHFADPVYPNLRGAEVGAMWRMLTSRAQGLSIEVRTLEAARGTGSATWLARYQFGPEQRPVANLVHSTFVFTDDLVQDQRDTFDFHGWAAMALGAKGRLLGWTPMLRNAVRQRAAADLRDFMAGSPG